MECPCCRVRVRVGDGDGLLGPAADRARGQGLHRRLRRERQRTPGIYRFSFRTEICGAILYACVLRGV